ncbi:MAG TPA: 4Fe-4S binding protein [Bacilli bacterium]|nr:MAG: NADH dehydrogenase subunit I [Tenericutes bacterium ADurb.BinA124]HNZ50771.1 4Fe-4S binding protein [Bacilli bacterium]HPN61013.1 4Fe-4S binding protein [Bacilli bacterium]HPX84139.1 4Fe-4S binding protein [Bacilli bacterium]
MLNKDGVPSLDQIKTCFPNLESLQKPKAIIECYEEIPCNPCSTSCPFKAIYIGPNINKRPQVDFNKCTGCGVCVYSCPGLAISVAQLVGKEVRFKISYEFLPLPQVGEIWTAINRSGQMIGKAKIEKVTLTKVQDKTALIQVLVDSSLLYDFITVGKKI